MQTVIYKINNKIIGKYIQYPVIIHNGKEYKIEYICMCVCVYIYIYIYIYESLLYTRNT